MLATVAWIGSITATSILFLPAASKALKPVDHLALIEAIQKRLEPIAWFCMSLLLLTGMFQMSVNPHYDGFVSTSTQWSLAILIKHIFGILMVVASDIQTWEVIPSIRRTLLNKNKANDRRYHLRAHVTFFLVRHDASCTATRSMQQKEPINDL